MPVFSDLLSAPPAAAKAVNSLHTPPLSAVGERGRESSEHGATSSIYWSSIAIQYRDRVFANANNQLVPNTIDGLLSGTFCTMVVQMLTLQIRSSCGILLSGEELMS